MNSFYSHPPRCRGGRARRAASMLAALLVASLGLSDAAPPGRARSARAPRSMLVALSDSLGHGTMDRTNNQRNTEHAFVQLVADQLDAAGPLFFSQPFFDDAGVRIAPFRIPTNLSVDGSDSFSLEGLEYYKRVGAETSFVSSDLLGDRLLPGRLDDKYDKVLYPLNLFNGGSVSQLDSGIWLLNVAAPALRRDEAIVLLWIGNNDSSSAALGFGGANPEFQPIPLEQAAPELKPLLRILLRFGERRGAVSFEPYTVATLERNLTNLDDFQAQFESLLSRLLAETAASGLTRRVFVCTLPYYSSVGYLLDSDDLEYYLTKFNPDYRVPASFARVTLPGEPITDPLRGDRVSLITFGFMLALLDSGYSVDYVNGILEENGVQRDGLVLSEAEADLIRQRIDGFNAIIRSAAAAAGPEVRIVETGPLLNDALSGEGELVVAGREFNRKWSRGGGLSLDGVHPGYTGQAFIANFLLDAIDAARGVETGRYDLDALALTDPYVDWDGDGWVPGPDVELTGSAALLLSLTDPDDTDPAVQPTLPDDFWDRLSDIFLGEILGIPSIRAEAERLGARR